MQKLIFYSYSGLFSVFCIGTLFLSSDSFVSEEITPKWYLAIEISALIFSVYYVDCFRYSGEILKKVFPFLAGITMFFCIALAVQGILQYLNTLSVLNTFRITGGFDNPAGYAASLCTGFPICFYFIRKDRNIYMRYGAIFVGCLVVLAVILSESRAGIVSLIVVVTAWVITQLKKKIKLWYIIVAFAFLLLSIAGLYFLKKDSADGRLLIWKCTWEMIKDKPLTGHGYSGFHAHYMNYQAEYFRQNPESNYVMLADNISSPFNEYLLLGVRYGVIGYTLLLVLFFFVWKAWRKKKSMGGNVAILILLAIGVFAFFSYPLTYPFPCMILFGNLFFLLGGLRFKPVFIGGAISVFLFVVCFFAWHDCILQMEWKRAAKASLIKQTPETFAAYERLYPKFNRNRLFLYNYSAELNYAGRYEKSIETGMICRKYSADYDLELLMGNNYLNLQDYGRAGQCFQRGSLMCPNRFMPLYNLFDIYRQMGRSREAQRIVDQILNKEVKIPSRRIQNIKREMEEFLDGETKNNTRMDK